MSIGDDSRRRRTRTQGLIILFKKFVAFFISHIGLCALVTAYMMLGSVIFRAIEAPHERDIHAHVRGGRRKAVTEMWKATYRYNVHKENWTTIAFKEADDYKQVLMKVIRKGYDANDQQDNTQWTFAGAFLYSLTVVTTIGYGNIACQTYFGKAMTIIYAILGIPLMLLFLTNIGDVLAKIFKFLYRKSVRLKLRIQVWNKRRKARQLRQANSVMAAAKTLQQMQQQQQQQQQLTSQQNQLQVQQQSSQSPSSPRLMHKGKRRHRQKISKSSRMLVQKVSTVSQPLQPHTGIGSSSSQSSSLQLLQHQQIQERQGSGGSARTPRASPRSNHVGGGQGSQESFPLQISTLQLQSNQTNAAAAIEQLALEQMRLETLAQRYEMEEYSLRESTEDKLSKVVVPLWLVFTTMLGYLMAGALLFTVWEGWEFFASFYFCFVSLATIGFGDLFPGTSLKDVGSAQEKLTITSLYLLFGMALIAMCFNLAQEEVVSKMTRIADKLGILQSTSDAGDSVYETES